MRFLAEPDRGDADAENRLRENRQRRDIDRALADDHKPNRVAQSGAEQSERENQNPGFRRQAPGRFDGMRAINQEIYQRAKEQ